MEPYYPNVKEKADFIKRVIKSEEERFHETLQEGLAILNNLLAKAKSSNNEINGSDAFKLYDTYGFPIELTEELASQENISVDMATFEKKWINNVHELEARQSSQSMQIQSEVLKNITTESKFVGYETTDYQTTLTDLIYNGEKLNLLNQEKLYISF